MVCTLAFLDPYGIDALPFTVIEALAAVRRMDMIVHISENGLQRNVIGKQQHAMLDRFCPGWPAHVDPSQPAHIVKRQILAYWIAKVEALGYKVSDNIVRVTAKQRQSLYWLVLVSRDDIADKFWSAGAAVNPQRSLL